MITFHLIGNAHLDPVWLWDWREGLNEGIATCRAVLDLMEEFPELTFSRGEAAIYEHIERYDPKTFRRILRRVQEGRWEVVGGTYVQPDTNLPATELLLRHFEEGLSYFGRALGRRPTVAWAPDSFGHSAGWPEIYKTAGMNSFVFSRPSQAQRPLPKPAFWWEGRSGARVLAYRIPVGWYGCERDEMKRRLDGYLAEAHTWGLENVAVFYGLGNHGGGPSRRHLLDIRAWAAAHPEVPLVHSTLHRFFAALRREIGRKGPRFLPVHRGELNFCLRGCYASVARFKFAYRRTESKLISAERTGAVIRAATGAAASDSRPAWKAVLFNSFHDILPGSSIERAYDDQLAWLGSAWHDSQQRELQALNALAARIDTSVRRPQGDKPCGVPILVWNPHPVPYRGHVELEASLDYRPIWRYQGRVSELPVRILGPSRKPLQFQRVATESEAFANLAWRQRAVARLEIPPLGWTVVEMGYEEGFRPPRIASAVSAPKRGVITNGLYTIQARKGARGIAITHKAGPLLASPGLTAVTVEDRYGSWGAMNEEPESLDLSNVLHSWKISDVRTVEGGPERAMLWVRLRGGNSRLDLCMSLCRERDAVDVAARVLWDERAARLKLVMPGADRAEFEVPGGTVKRGPCGEVPGGRWVRTDGRRGSFGFASDALYCFDLKENALRVTVARASRYASDAPSPANAEPWRPTVDAGELRFRFLLTRDVRSLPRLSAELEQPPVTLLCASHSGALARRGSLASLSPASLKLLALATSADGKAWILRLQETSGRAVTPHCTWLGQRLRLSPLAPYAIGAWRLTSSRRGWKSTSLPGGLDLVPPRAR
ncbi:MAG: glycoside hydrolase family 38 [Candidatus Brocadiia bacterium]